MKNYKYRLGDEDFVLSEKEHEYCLGELEKGKKIMVLRGGKLVINLSFLRSVNETDDATEVERLKGGENIQLQSPTLEREREQGKGFLRSDHNSYYEKMGWEHDNCSEDAPCKAE